MVKALYITGAIIFYALATISSSLCRELTPAENALIAEAVTKKLADPDSAKIRFHEYDGSGIYCGELNAKNLYGGYVGYDLFLVFVKQREDGTISSASTAFIAADPTFSIMDARTMCTRHNPKTN